MVHSSTTRVRVTVHILVVVAMLVGVAAQAQSVPSAAPSAVDELIASIDDPGLRSLIDEALERNPELASARAQLRAAEAAIDRIAWPDPMAGASLYLAPPETRVGPQRLMLTLGQRIPWFGKLGFEDRAAVAKMVAARSRIEAHRLELIGDVRRLAIELAFLARQQHITEEFRDHLIRHEELARSRYSTGLGQGQGVVKMQAEITRAESNLLTLDSRRRSLMTRLNALRDRGAGEPIVIDEDDLLASDATVQELLSAFGAPTEVEIAGGVGADLAGMAMMRRPELDAARAAIAAAEARGELAARQERPDVTLGLTYTLVERRDDRGGRQSPPQGNGNDVFGLTGSVSLPFLSHSRARIAAGVSEAEALAAVARSRLAGVEREIRAEVDDLSQRLPLLAKQVDLIGRLLILQAEESLRSAETGYSSGRLEALDLFDAEHVLFEAQVAVVRARTDLAIVVADLEAAIAAPLDGLFGSLGSIDSLKPANREAGE